MEKKFNQHVQEQAQSNSTALKSLHVKDLPEPEVCSEHCQIYSFTSKNKLMNKIFKIIGKTFHIFIFNESWHQKKKESNKWLTYFLTVHSTCLYK